MQCAVSRELPVETETIQTQLHQSTNEEHYTYTNVPWRLYLRKEVSTYTNKYLCSLLVHASKFSISGPLSVSVQNSLTALCRCINLFFLNRFSTRKTVLTILWC